MKGRPTDAGKPRTIPRTFRLTEGENVNLEQQAADRGFSSVSDYLRYLVHEDEPKAIGKRANKRPWDE